METTKYTPSKTPGSNIGKILLVALLVVVVFAALGTAIYFAFYRNGPTSDPNKSTTYALMALGGDCTSPCASNPTVCSRGITSSTFIALGNGTQPLISILDGAPTVAFGIPGMVGSYTFPSTAEASAFLTAVLVSKDSSGNPHYTAGMFNASAPTGGTVYPAGLFNGPDVGDDGARFAAFVAQALKPRNDGLTNLALFVVLNGGPNFFAPALAQGYPSPGNSAWNVQAALGALGHIPVWSSLAPGSSQPYCGCYNFSTKTYTESTALPNCVAALTGTVSL
jgi:hypothetical protein